MEFIEFFKSKFSKEKFSKPYPKLADLPEAVKELPKHGQEIFQGAFNSAFDNPPKGRKPEEYAFRVAWGAVKDKYKKEDDKWVEKMEVKKDVEIGMETKELVNSVDIDYAKRILESARVLKELVIKNYQKQLRKSEYDAGQRILAKAKYLVGLAKEYHLEKQRKVEKERVVIKEKSVEKSFEFFIEKAYLTDDEGMIIQPEYKKFTESAEVKDFNKDKMFVEGVASTINVDQDEERMSPEAIDAMVEKINKDGVPLRSEHQKTWDAVLGWISKAWKDERDQIHIKAKLDPDNSRSLDLYKALKKGLQIGLSVAGNVKKSGIEIADGLGKKVKTFYDVILKEISVTNRPSNFDTWLIAKSKSGSLTDHLFKAPIPEYSEYLKEFPNLDYQFQIAKSVAEISKKMPEPKKEETTTTETTETKPEETKCNKETKKETTTEGTTTGETTTEGTTTETKPVEKEKTEGDDLIKQIADGFTSLAKELRDFIKQPQREPKETTSVAGERTTTTETEKPKAERATTTSETEKGKVKKEETTTTPEKKPEETTTTTTTEEETTKSISEERVLAETIAKAIREQFEKEGKRIIGPLVEQVQKMIKTPNKRKGIASEKVYTIEKNIGNEGGEGGEDEIQKDLKNPKIGFQGFFKKHLSSFGEDK